MLEKSRLGLPSWSSSDSTICRLRWCPGLLGVSASRLLCFFPTGGGHSAVVLVPSFLLFPSRKCLLPQFQTEPAPKHSPPICQNSLATSFFTSFISVSAKLFFGPFHSFSHSFANSEACKTNDSIQ